MPSIHETPPPRKALTPAQVVAQAEAKAKREALEHAFLLQCRHVHLSPVAQFKVPGLNYIYDFAFVASKLLIEIQGGTAQKPVKMGERWWIQVSGHNSMDGIQRDCQKSNQAQLRGWRVLKFTAQDIADRTSIAMVQECLESASLFGGEWCL
jgi:very-short-patch-repair endonuclease